jgi:hypothetical protein
MHAKIRGVILLVLMGSPVKIGKLTPSGRCSMLNTSHFAGVIEKALETAAALSKRAANHEIDEALIHSSLAELKHTIDELRIAQAQLNEA